jgi:hypothetical protein
VPSRTSPPLPTPLPAVAHTPVIIYVNFPTAIRGAGGNVRGTIKLSALGHDVNLVTFLTIEGIPGEGSWYPTGTITWNGDVGLMPFDAGCMGALYVRTRVTLKDAAGNRSFPSDFAFRCY